MRRGWAMFCLAAAAGVAAARAGGEGLTLCKLFSDHAVLQRGVAVPVWGWAEAGTTVTVHFARQAVTATADAGGKWSARLAPLDASAEPAELTVSAGEDTVTARDVLVGEVWLAAGQANMRVGEPPASELPAVRFFNSGTAYSPVPRSTIRWGAWHPHSTNTTAMLSSIAGTFARRVHAGLGVPVGVIVAARDASEVERWMNREAFELFPGRFSYPSGEELARMDAVLDRWNRRETECDRAWAGAAAVLRIHGVQPSEEQRTKMLDPFRVKLDQTMQWGEKDTTVFNTIRGARASLYNGMIAPMAPFAIRGVIWFQGEWDGGSEVAVYFYRFAPLIAGWRVAWGQGAFPFLFAQTQDMQEGEMPPQPPDPPWYAGVREAQRLALQLPNTGMAVTFDALRGLRPANREVAGERLARCALGTVYASPGVIPSGPLYESAVAEGSRLRVRFRHAEGGLVLREAGGAAKPFLIRGADTAFVAAEARVEGNDLILSNRGVEAPVAARYAWGRPLVAVLFGKGGLPASPFATDQACTADFTAARARFEARKQSGGAGRGRPLSEVEDAVRPMDTPGRLLR